MMNQKKFKKAAILRRTTALLATVLFHGVLFSVLFYGADATVEMLPEFAQNWFATTPVEEVASTQLP